jgi:hypothetical protein
MKARVAIIFLLLVSHNVRTQAQKGEAAAVAIGAGLAIFTAAAAYDAFVEKLENEATEWVLENRPELKQFQLKIMNLRGEKITNMSEISSCTFLVTPDKGEKFVLMWIVSYGWWNEYGVSYNSIKVKTFNKEQWSQIVLAFLKCGVKDFKGTRDSIPIYYEFEFQKAAENSYSLSSKNSSIENSSFEKVYYDDKRQKYYALQHVVGFYSLYAVRGNMFEFYNAKNPGFPIALFFQKLDGDTYVVQDLEDMRVIYNERAINLFFEDIKSLVKFRNAIFEDITKELLGLIG